MTTTNQPICTQEAAVAAGLDIAPTPAELRAVAESIVSAWGDRWADPNDLPASIADAGAQLARAVPLVLADAANLRVMYDAVSKRENDLINERDTLRAQVAELEAERSTVIAARDGQIITWLAKKAYEYGTSNRENRAKAEAVGRMADKLSRGAVRPPLSRGPDPMIVSRYDTAMEPALEEEQIFIVGAIDETGRPVALQFTREDRAKVGQWLTPDAEPAEAVCTHCGGDGVDPEDPGDYDPAVHMHNPGTRGPCPECHGIGRKLTP